ncbi:hypothetical protein GC197_14975 [bacterium]|nr:hypothetical protein [bacterium]
METVSDLLDQILLEIAASKNARIQGKELTAFCGVAGSEYDHELMVVGRAVNGGTDGWNAEQVADEAFRRETIENLLEKRDQKRLQWVLGCWQKSGRRCNDCNARFQRRSKQCPECNSDNTRKLYNTAKSQFWRVIRRVVLNLEFGQNSQTSWANQVAWTNLYKVSPHGGGNPSSALCSLQWKHCEKILRHEITTWKPRRILFLAGYDWANNFCKALGIHGSELKETRFVQFTGIHSETNAKVVVGPHPQGKRVNCERSYAAELVKCFA